MEKTEKIRNRIFRIIEIGNREDIPSTVFDIFISITIVASILTTFLHTFSSISGNPVLLKVEFFSIVVFVIEYILRLWTADYLYPEKRRAGAVFAFIISFYGVIDLITIVSYFLPYLFSTGVVVLRMLRVIRIFRLFRLSTNYDAFNVIVDVLKAKKDALLSSVFVIVMLMFMTSLCMYSLEHEAQPEVFKNAFSGIWWSASTILTVGYGDIYPITTAGRIVAIFMAFLGVGLVAIPTGIISAGFVEYYSKINGNTQVRLLLKGREKSTVYQCSKMECCESFTPNPALYVISEDELKQFENKAVVLFYPVDSLDIIAGIYDSISGAKAEIERVAIGSGAAAPKKYFVLERRL